MSRHQLGEGKRSDTLGRSMLWLMTAFVVVIAQSYRVWLKKISTKGLVLFRATYRKVFSSSFGALCYGFHLYPKL